MTLLKCLAPKKCQELPLPWELSCCPGFHCLNQPTWAEASSINCCRLLVARQIYGLSGRRGVQRVYIQGELWTDQGAIYSLSLCRYEVCRACSWSDCCMKCGHPRPCYKPRLLVWTTTLIWVWTICIVLFFWTQVWAYKKGININLSLQDSAVAGFELTDNKI